MKQLRRSIGRNRVHTGVLLASALAASVGCSDDGATNPPADDGDSGISTDQSLASDTNSSGGTGGISSEVVAPTSETTDDGNVSTDHGDVTSEPTVPQESSAPQPTWAQTSGMATSEQAASGSDAGSTTPVFDTTEDADGPVAPPGNMTVITSYDAVAGFDDSASDVDVVRWYEDSMMSLDISFTGSGQLAGVNHNYPGGSADMCGHDLVARIRLTSGTIEGGVQLRVWSDNWDQFSSQITTLPPIGVSEWIEYRITWEQAVANDNLGNGVLNIRSINAVGLAFMTFGDATTVHADVDWIGLVPSETPCPDDPGPDAGSSTAPDDTVDSSADTSAVPDVDASTIDSSDVELGDAGGSMALDASL